MPEHETLTFLIARRLLYFYTAASSFLRRLLRTDGGRGRIRTSVARKERQIYSLLVLATHPPVRTGKTVNAEIKNSRLYAQRDTRPFSLEDGNTATLVWKIAPAPLMIPNQLAEGFEPPTL